MDVYVSQRFCEIALFSCVQQKPSLLLSCNKRLTIDSFHFFRLATHKNPRRARWSARDFQEIADLLPMNAGPFISLSLLRVVFVNARASRFSKFMTAQNTRSRTSSDRCIDAFIDHRTDVRYRIKRIQDSLLLPREGSDHWSVEYINRHKHKFMY